MNSKHSLIPGASKIYISEFYATIPKLCVIYPTPTGTYTSNASLIKDDFPDEIGPITM